MNSNWKIAIMFLSATLLVASAAAQSFTMPAQVTADTPVVINTSGSGDAEFFVVGQGLALRRNVRLGQTVKLQPGDLHAAGYYVAVLRSGGNVRNFGFYVLPGPAATMSFLARPSRLPVAVRDGINGVAYVFDKSHNLVTDSQRVQFQLSVPGLAPATASVPSRNGLAWIRFNSARKAGPAKFTAAVADVKTDRVIQQVPADACSLRIRVQRSKAGVIAETDPVRDCSGNPVSDGTIVTFTETSGSDVSTVDAPVKRGVARAELPARPGAVITAAMGVVMGNEVRVGGL
jgi:hypothetical protein